ncbi:hypothetical protein GYMLUDRAFT_164196 [Collybiopsis luxurians FD-317 M1]|uniref:Yeast cell wall synthesis Kre9/Knh1-like N-terminal domain-containing protein n=1 Tax=Collybiopsis luxurians FD-317 M1 TaxID=944289 RepID=A0A0D0D177_9AGAR|nr:hypothetical protein GYMLUDRAFT_164196 [Collybiopsis luxurians FD-317 M1]
MQFTLSIASALAALSAVTLSHASPVPPLNSAGRPPAAEARAMLDVWAPTIFTPNASSVWAEGKQYNVTWDTSDAPQNISNAASVVLGNNTRLTDRVLAANFDLRRGWVTVTCPDDIFPGKNYSIILFGDSGDQSQQFSIVLAGNSAYGDEGEGDNEDQKQDEADNDDNENKDDDEDNQDQDDKYEDEGDEDEGDEDEGDEDEGDEDEGDEDELI